MGVTRSPTAAPFAAWLADNLSSMPAAVTPSPASAAEAVCPENRVKALDFLAWPRIGVQGPETPDTRWGNRPRYDGKAVGSVLARYYDPTTAQFLTVDPDIATTLSPYGYVQGDPLNSADPTGMCGWAPWDAVGCVVGAAQNAAGWTNQHIIQPVVDTATHLCVRNPFGAGWNSNNNGGCQTVLSGSQGAKLIAATVAIGAATVFTAGVGDAYIATYLGLGEEGTALASLGQVGLLLHAWPIFGLGATMYGIGGYLIWSALTNPPTSTSGTSGCP